MINIREFNEIVLKQVGSIFSKYNLRLIENYKNYLKFKSDEIVVVICHDEKEKSNLLYVGKDENNLYLFDGNIIKKFFIPELKAKLKIPENTVSDFANNLSMFFTGSGQILLNNDDEILPDIVKYIENKSRIYTNKIIQKQAIEAASEAWMVKDYVTFVENIDKIGVNKVPESFKLKYKAAKRKL